MAGEEASARWRKSQRSLNVGECVEVWAGPAGDVQVRDSKDPDGPVLRFDRDTWRSFIADVKGNRFDLADDDPAGPAAD